MDLDGWRRRVVTAQSGSPAVLWDVDGTLLAPAGQVAELFLDAVELVCERRPIPDDVDLGGRMDPEIASLLVRSAGGRQSQVATVISEFTRLADVNSTLVAASIHPLDGVLEVVRGLQQRGVVQTVLTGNIETVARLKLDAAGLSAHLDADLGGFGDSAPHRVGAALVALQHLLDSGWPGGARQCWIVGDTPRDAACAHELGISCALVATGRFSAAALGACGADLVLDDLTDGQELLRRIVG
ncbi:MAG TPA: haloacid dehalogenase-like hydrolase [Jatrophihabitans sp.]